MDEYTIRLRAGLDADTAALVDGGGCRCGDGPTRPDCADRIAADVEVKRAILCEYERTGTLNPAMVIQLLAGAYDGYSK